MQLLLTFLSSLQFIDVFGWKLDYIPEALKVGASYFAPHIQFLSNLTCRF